MVAKFLLILGTLVLSCVAQSPYVRRPVGYPVLLPTSTTTTTQSTGVVDRAGDNATTMRTTTERLPSEAAGNQALVDALRKLPVDRQPFWLLNRRALEEQRDGGRTFEQRPSFFIDSLSDAGARQRSLVSQEPDTFAQRPENFAQSPQNFYQIPQDFEQIPQNFGQRQPNFIRRPPNTFSIIKTR